jgi:hypothetical protein
MRRFKWMAPRTNFSLKLRLVAAALAFATYSNVALAGLPQISKGLSACYTIFNDVYEAVDAIPFTGKLMDAHFSKRWRKNFDLQVYHREHEKFMKMEKMGLEEWGFPETELAYLTALIEKSTANSKMPGLKFTITDALLDDPRHARELQLLTKDLDFSKNLSRFQLEGAVQRAFILTGKLDLKFGDLLKMDPDRMRELMRLHLWKELAKEGVADVYAKMGLLVYTRSELNTMRAEAARAILAGRKPAHLAEEIDAMLVESTVTKWKRWQKDPKVQALLLLPTWNPATVASKLRPGVMPKVQWVRFPPEFLKKCIEIGVDNCIGMRIAGTTRFLVTQRIYDYLTAITAVWAGVFTFGYAIGQLNDHSTEDIQDWMIRQATGPTREAQAEFENNPGTVMDPVFVPSP